MYTVSAIRTARQDGARRYAEKFLPVLFAATCFVASLTSAAAATTFYVRTDGGSSTQCTGKSNIAYPGSGTNIACAWSHPFEALPPGGAPRIAGGDTLIIGSGSYMMGLGVPNTSTSACYPAWAYDCHMPPIPSGPSAAAPTRILGAGYDTGCTAAPELWGTERTAKIINLEGSSNVQVGCLEVTDHSSCIEFHCANGTCGGEVNQCQRNTSPYGAWASTGVSASASSNVTLQDLNIHSLANRGIVAGGLTNWNVLRTKIKANGWAGWDGDIGANSSNSGQIYLSQVEIAWNGCGETYPDKRIFGCWGQQGGGYGDGLGTAATGGNWVIEDSFIHHNTSDGIDLLYANGTGSINIRRVHAEGNAGNQIKTKGSATIENSVVVGNCAYFSTLPNMNMTDGDECRALGNTLSLAITTGATVNVRYNTITGQGDCLILNGGGDATAKLNIQNNALIGQTDWRQNWESTCLQYSDGGTPAITFLSNLIWTVKDAVCPSGSTCGVNPKLSNIGISTFDPTPLPGSPVIDHANMTVSLPVDERNLPRPSGSSNDIGAIEYQNGTEGVIFSSNFGG
jgi:hypothetical protein